MIKFEELSHHPEPTSPSGFRTSGPASIGVETDVIPVKADVGFGIDYQVTGLEPHSTAKCQFVILHPRFTTDDGRVFEKQEYEIELKAGPDGIATHLSGYVMGTGFRPPPGEWTFQIWHAQRRLVQKTFQLVPAEN